MSGKLYNLVHIFNLPLRPVSLALSPFFSLPSFHVTYQLFHSLGALTFIVSHLSPWSVPVVIITHVLCVLYF